MARWRSSFFLRHLLASLAILWGIVAAGILIAMPFSVLLLKPPPRGHQVEGIANLLVSAAAVQSPESVIGRLGHSSGDLYLLDASGKVIVTSPGAPQLAAVDPKDLPREVHRVRGLTDENPGPNDAAIVLLGDSEPKRYLAYRPPPHPGPEGFMMIAILFFVSLGILGAMGWSSYVLLKKLGRHARQAADVMARLEAGELGARLAIERRDEFGELMGQFNLMAEQLELLFARVREAEKARIHVLQDIGHDLRTPLSSLLNLFDVLRGKFDSLGDAEKKAFLTTGWGEVKYTQRLVEDLLFLARVEDPTCSTRDEVFDLTERMLADLAAFEATSGLPIERKIPEGVTVRADKQLLARLLRNAFGNALSYAAEGISISLEVAGDTVRICVEDDGPGFSEEALRTFGKKRPTRLVHDRSGSRASLGLGSVIMAAIARRYEGTLEPSNRLREGKVIGGRITVSLRISASIVRQSRAA